MFEVLNLTYLTHAVIRALLLLDDMKTGIGDRHRAEAATTCMVFSKLRCCSKLILSSNKAFPLLYLLAEPLSRSQMDLF